MGEPGGVSLLDAVAAGRVPRPSEMPFSEWLKWRAGSGKRPTLEGLDVSLLW